MKGGGLKDSREGALCDSGSLAGDLAEECSTAEKKIMMHDHERKSRQQAHGRRFTPCRKLPGRDSFPQRADARGSTGNVTAIFIHQRRLTPCCKVPPFVFYGKGKNQLPLTHQ